MGRLSHHGLSVLQRELEVRLEQSVLISVNSSMLTNVSLKCKNVYHCFATLSAAPGLTVPCSVLVDISHCLLWSRSVSTDIIGETLMSLQAVREV